MTVAFCFAFLQALQPFIHAHLDGEHHPHSEGLHTAEDHESAHALEHLSSHAMLDASHAAHTISVSQGIKQDSAYALGDSFSFVLIALAFLLVIVITSTRFLQPSSNPTRSFKRRSPAARAPPVLQILFS